MNRGPWGGDSQLGPCISGGSWEQQELAASQMDQFITGQ